MKSYSSIKNIIAWHLLLLVPIFVFGGGEWKLSKDRNGIKVYTRITDNSKLKDAKAEIVVRTSIGEAYELLTDFPGQKEWMDRIAESKLLKKVSDKEYYVYYLGNAPWPVADRDIVTHCTIKTHEDGKIRIDYDSRPDYIPEKEGIVRVKRTNSFWELIPMNNRKIRVVYYSSSDPGGNIPDWMVNTSATDLPYNTLMNFKDILEAKE